MKTVPNTLYSVKIILHRNSFAASNGNVLYFRDGLSYVLINKYRQYFRYRMACFQVSYPSQCVELRIFGYETKDKDAEIQFTKNKLRAAKAKLTEWNNKVAKYKLQWSSLFSIDDDLAYQKAMAKIEKQKARIIELETEINDTIQKSQT